jgi:hypothetical protein
MESNQEDDGSCLSDAHRDFIVRYMEWELKRQAQVSERYLRSKRSAAVDRAIQL